MLKKWKLTFQTTAIVAGIMLLKCIVQHLGWEQIQLNSLFGSIIAGGVFLIGMILTGTLSDFKECEKIPAEIVASLENIYEEARLVRQKWAEFDLPKLRRTLQDITRTFQSDLAIGDGRQCLEAISRLSESFTEMDTLGLAPNALVRLKSEQGNVRKHVLRVYHIQRTNFVPSAYILVDAIITIIIFLLISTKIGGRVDSIILVGFISYLFIYMLRLLRTIDKPFHVGEKTMDDVSRFLLKEFDVRLEQADESSTAPTPVNVLE